MVLFALYLAAFAAFGLWASALTYSRVLSFLLLVGLWSLWVFVLPNAAVRAAEAVVEVEEFSLLERENERLRWNLGERTREARYGYWSRTTGWDTLALTQKGQLNWSNRALHEEIRQIDEDAWTNS